MLRFLTVGLGHLFRSRGKRAAKLEGSTGTDSSKASGGDGDTPSEPEMGFLDHLEELRFMLLRCIGAFVISMTLTFCFANRVMEFMRRPLQEAVASSKHVVPKAAETAVNATTAAQADSSQLLTSLGSILLNGEIPAAAPAAAAVEKLSNAEATFKAAAEVASGQSVVVLKFMDVFSILLNIGLIGGLALSSGFILYFASRFVGPALTAHEKKCVVPFCVSAIVLFFGGCAFSFFWLIPISIQVMFHFVSMFDLQMNWIGSDYFGFVTMMTLLVGLTFQFPLVVVILQYLEIVQTRTLFRLWRHVLIGILVASLVISPLGDPVSLSVLTSVLFLLYIIAASVGGVLVRRKIKKRDAEEAEYERTYGKPHPRRAALENSDSSTTEDYGNDYNAEGGTEGYTGGSGDGSDYYGDGSYDSSQDGLARDDTSASDEGGESSDSGVADSDNPERESGESSGEATGEDAGAATGETTEGAAEERTEEVSGESAGETADAPASDLSDPKDSKDLKDLKDPTALTPPAASTPLGRQSDLDLIE